MGFKKEILPIFLMLIIFMPTGYYFAGKVVYDGVAYTNTDCWGNFDQNTPEQFAPLRNEVPLNESSNSENISSNIMEGLSEYWWPGYEHATIEVEGEDLFLSAWFLRQNESMPWVIFVHGIRGCKSGGELLISSGMIANAGFNVISFDLRDHGESSIDDNRVSGGQDEWKDVVAVFDWLVEEQGAEPDEIGLFGTSMGAGTVAIAFSLDDRMQSVWLDSGYADMGAIVVEELEFLGYPTFLGSAGIFAGKISAGQNLVEHYPLEAASEIGDRHMYVVHGNQDERVRLHHGTEMCEEAMKNGVEGNIECWFKDSVIRYDVGEGMQSDEHVTLMLTDTDEYETRLVGFFTESLM
jgi:dipeptidyl aminopeptidase/acylaminoacyl peptidase|tara:strand:- start:1396 stop:2451 length:1056 start_codon:yes stop_codon:yes gene_type:complete